MKRDMQRKCMKSIQKLTRAYVMCYRYLDFKSNLFDI